MSKNKKNLWFKSNFGNMPGFEGYLADVTDLLAFIRRSIVLLFLWCAGGDARYTWRAGVA